MFHSSKDAHIANITPIAYKRKLLAHNAVLVYKLPMAQQNKTERVQLLMTPDELKKVDDWRYAHRARSQADAIRQLIEAGLKATEDS